MHTYVYTHAHTQLLQLINKHIKVVGYKIVRKKLPYSYTLATNNPKIKKTVASAIASKSINYLRTHFTKEV